MMWKKGESDETGSGAAPPPASSSRSAPRRSAAQADRATIGPSIVIKGDVSGEEDLLIQGRVEGTINLGQYQVLIGSEGKVKADVNGRTVAIEGEVEGDLQGGEQVILRPSARVRGNIVAPRVILEDGAMFKGSIDMSIDDGQRPVSAVSAARPAAAKGAPAAKDAAAQEAKGPAEAADLPAKGSPATG